MEWDHSWRVQSDQNFLILLSLSLLMSPWQVHLLIKANKRVAPTSPICSHSQRSEVSYWRLSWLGRRMLFILLTDYSTALRFQPNAKPPWGYPSSRVPSLYFAIYLTEVQCYLLFALRWHLEVTVMGMGTSCCPDGWKDSIVQGANTANKMLRGMGTDNCVLTT